MEAIAQQVSPATSRPGQAVQNGVAGGLAGGLIFGMMMAMMGMIPMVASLVGSSSVAVGWGLHLGISAVIGGLYGLGASRVPARGLAVGLGAGAAYGMLWWVLGPLLLMPARLGMPLFSVDAMAVKSLMGHVIFGMVLGAVVAVLAGHTARGEG